VQFLLVLGSMLAGVVLLPTSGWRRLGAFTLVCVVLLLWVTFGLQHAAGNVVHPVTFWRFVLDQGAVVLLAAVGGWVIARGRHPWSWTVVILAIIPALVTPILVEHSFPSSAIALISQGIVAVVGLGAVWLAVWIDRRLTRRAGGAEVSDTSEGPDATASDPPPLPRGSVLVGQVVGVRPERQERREVLAERDIAKMVAASSKRSPSKRVTSSSVRVMRPSMYSRVILVPSSVERSWWIHCHTCEREISAVAASSMRLSIATAPRPAATPRCSGSPTDTLRTRPPP
jgi:uncharacterized membrane protein YvlD (DUF360 family)